MNKISRILLIIGFYLISNTLISQDNIKDKDLEISNLKINLLESRLQLLETSINNVHNIPDILRH